MQSVTKWIWLIFPMRSARLLPYSHLSSCFHMDAVYSPLYRLNVCMLCIGECSCRVHDHSFANFKKSRRLLCDKYTRALLAHSHSWRWNTARAEFHHWPKIIEYRFCGFLFAQEHLVYFGCLLFEFNVLV